MSYFEHDEIDSDWDGFYHDSDPDEDDGGDPAWHVRCGHFHLDQTLLCPWPNESCGDYRCCQP